MSSQPTRRAQTSGSRTIACVYWDGDGGGACGSRAHAANLAPPPAVRPLVKAAASMSSRLNERPRWPPRKTMTVGWCRPRNECGLDAAAAATARAVMSSSPSSSSARLGPPPSPYIATPTSNARPATLGTCAPSVQAKKSARCEGGVEVALMGMMRMVRPVWGVRRAGCGDEGDGGGAVNGWRCAPTRQAWWGGVGGAVMGSRAPWAPGSPRTHRSSSSSSTSVTTTARPVMRPDTGSRRDHWRPTVPVRMPALEGVSCTC